MVWASIKATAFVGLAVATGVVCTSVPIAGKTISARLSEASAAARRSSAAGSIAHRPDADAAPVAGVAALKQGRIDPHAVATVIPDQPAGDNLHDSERQAIAHLIEQRAHPAKTAPRP